MYPSTKALIIGNGPSREKYRLKEAEQNGVTTFGCNRIIDEFMPDYVVAIDGPAIKYLFDSTMPKHRLLVPCLNEHWEQPELHGGNGQARRSNAGCNAVLEALRREFDTIYLIGFDYLLTDPFKASDNIFKGLPEYQTIPTPDDNMNRLTYFKHIMNGAPDGTRFVLLYPPHYEDIVIKVSHPKLKYKFVSTLKEIVNE